MLGTPCIASGGPISFRQGVAFHAVPCDWVAPGDWGFSLTNRNGAAARGAGRFQPSTVGCASLTSTSRRCLRARGRHSLHGDRGEVSYPQCTHGGSLSTIANMSCTPPRIFQPVAETRCTHRSCVTRVGPGHWHQQARPPLTHHPPHTSDSSATHR